jgi:hypothetical protein
MDIIKNTVNNQLLFKLSQIGYALSCHLLFTNRISEIVQDINLVNHLKDGDKIKSFKHKYPNAFTDLDSIHELLLQT